MESDTQLPQALEKRMTCLLFSGDFAPGSKITERDLARELGMSRIPVREGLAKLVSRGVLVKNERNRSVHLRHYSAEEVMHLFELREALEVAAARLACVNATATDLLEMEIVCDRMDEEVETPDAPHWADLDRLFHETMVRSSQNARLIDSFSSLIRECHYVFYRHPARWGRQLGPDPEEEKIPAEKQEETLGRRKDQMREIVAEHRKILELIRAKDADGAQDYIRARLRDLANGIVRIIVTRAFSKRNPTQNHPAQ